MQCHQNTTYYKYDLPTALQLLYAINIFIVQHWWEYKLVQLLKMIPKKYSSILTISNLNIVYNSVL